MPYEPGRYPRWLLDGSGAIWLAWNEGVILTVASWMDGEPEKVSAWQASSSFGWDATVDSQGNLWLTWSEDDPVGANVFVQRHADGAWGPKLQVSTTGSNIDPLITPDEYGNVWVFWERCTEGSDIVMCRMGPRSGQETLVARNASRPRSVVTRQGILYVTYGDFPMYAVTGTEHQGFGEPLRVG